MLLVNFCPAAGRAVEIHHRHHVTPRREQVVVPPRAPGIEPGALGAAVHQVGQRVFPGRIEARRLEQPGMHRVAQRTHEAEALERRQVEAGQRGGVERGRERSPGAIQPDGENLRRHGGALPHEDQTIAAGADLHRVVEPSGHDAGSPTGGDVLGIEGVHPPLFDLEDEAPRVRRPDEAARR